jgi:hypothetical protein
VSVIDRIAAEHRDAFVAVLAQEDPALLETLRGKDVPSYQEWETVQEVLNDEFSRYYGPDHEPDETGVKIDNALGAFMTQFPGDELPDYPYR